jgi:hypothetical protein
MGVSDEEGIRWLRRVVSEIGAIHAGDTRRRLLATFRPAGGFAPIPNPMFVHRKYPIAVDVRFSPATPAKGKKSQPSEVESDDDVIEWISRPYFAEDVMD